MRSSHRSKPTRMSKWSSLTAPSKASFLRTTISLRNLMIQLVYHLDRQGCNHCPTCWYGLVVPRWRRLHRSGGRATAVGSELALACDMRFASREKAILSQFEVGAGIVPGGGPMAQLPRLIGRGRALEVLLGADDIPGDLAERYGYVNRSFPDADLDAFIESLATRIASVDKRAISETKRFVDVASLPPDFEIAPEWDVCLASIARPAAQERIRMLMERGFHQPGDVEDRLGYHVGQLGR